MQYIGISIPGAYLIELEPQVDERGFFARTVCIKDFQNHEINGHMVQQSISWNTHKGTLRGIHFQAFPHEEEKLVRVTQGAIYDVIVDLRIDSPAYGHWQAFELNADNRLQLFIPKGVAHGFQTTVDNTEVLYEMTSPFHPDASRGIRWDDTTLAIKWPYPDMISKKGRISPKDKMWPSLSGIQEHS